MVSGDSWSCDTCDYGLSPVRSVDDLEMVDDESGVTWLGEASDLGIDARRWPSALILYGFDDQKATFELVDVTPDNASYFGILDGEDVNILIEAGNAKSSPGLFFLNSWEEDGETKYCWVSDDNASSQVFDSEEEASEALNEDKLEWSFAAD